MKICILDNCPHGGERVYKGGSPPPQKKAMQKFLPKRVPTSETEPDGRLREA